MTDHSDDFPSTGRLAAVDYGRRRIGIAVCDRERMLASPLAVREPARRQDLDAAYYRRLVDDEELVGFIVGLPLHADGRESEMSAEARAFGAWLAEVTQRPVVYQDERYTSAAADGRLAGVGLTRGRKKARADAVAAQIMLETWLARTAVSHRGPRPDHGVAP
jgi:putative Holliday junction resolvase